MSNETEREAFEETVRQTCRVDEHTFKLSRGAYFRLTAANTYDCLPARELASVQTLFDMFRAGAAWQRAQAQPADSPTFTGHFTMPAQPVETPQHARDSAELRRLCAERDQLKADNGRLRQRIADGLRWRAREIRNAAQYAERLSDARDELLSAHRMEVEADHLDGKVAPAVERPVQPNAEEIAARRRARMDAVIADLEQRFGPNREKPLTK